MTTPILDVTQHSALAICPIPRCGWRSIQVTEDFAVLRYHEHYVARHAQPTSRPCRWCGETKGVMPRKALCQECHKADRATKARAKYRRSHE